MGSPRGALFSFRLAGKQPETHTPWDAGPYLENRAFGRAFVLPRAVAPSRREPCGARAAATAPKGAEAATALRRIPPRGRAIPRQPAHPSKIPILDPASHGVWVSGSFLSPPIGKRAPRGLPMGLFFGHRVRTLWVSGSFLSPPIGKRAPRGLPMGLFFGHRVRTPPRRVLFSALPHPTCPRGEIYNCKFLSV